MSADGPNHDPFTLILITGIMAIAIVAFWPLMSVIILALTLAIVALPLHRRLSTLIKPGISAFLTTTLVFLILIGVIAFTGYIIYQNADFISQIITDILYWIQGPPQSPNSFAILEMVSGQVGTIGERLTEIIGQIPFFAIEFLIFFLTFYLAVLGGDSFHATLVRIIPGRFEDAYALVKERCVNTLYAVWVVHFIIALVTFLLAVPFFWFIGTGHIFFFAFVAAFFQLIPILGDSVLMIFLAVYAVSKGDYQTAILLLAVGYPVVSAFPDLYLRPLLMGKRASIHPVLMWIGFFGGILVMGISGFILGPLLVALLVSGYALLKEEKITKPSESHTA